MCLTDMLMHFYCFNTLRPRQMPAIPDDIFKSIFLNKNECISIKIPLNVVPRGPINNMPVLVQMMACCRSGDKPLSEPTMVSLLKFICVTRPRWVRWWRTCGAYLRQWTGSSLVEVVARHRSVHMLIGPRGTNSNQIIWFPFDKKCIYCYLQNVHNFVKASVNWVCFHRNIDTSTCPTFMCSIMKRNLEEKIPIEEKVFI